MTEAAPETKTKASKNPERDKAIRSAYAVATKRLRETHLDEFRTFQKEELAKSGITDWEPAPTAKEKAQAELAALLDANPELESDLVDRLKKIEENAPAE
jgi:hypothetical protein